MKPIIKWVGGKSQIKDNILSKFPEKINKYYEPFIGGGSILIELLCRVRNNKISVNKFYASDINPRLINLYKQVQRNPHKISEKLKLLEVDYKVDPENFYYKIRDKFNEDFTTALNDATYFIFLNRTYFRGLYRENSEGKFNVLFGHYKNPSFPDEEIMQLSDLIKDVEFVVKDFRFINSEPISGDFVYLDPPYYPINSTSFTTYSGKGFDEKCHKRLFRILRNLRKKSIYFILSNSYVDEVIQNFDENKFIIEIIECKRRINSKNPESTVSEVIISPIL